MTKRAPDRAVSSAIPAIKKPRIDDPASSSLINALEGMSITSRCSFNALSSIENHDVKRMTQLRNDYKETLQQITFLPDQKNKGGTKSFKNSIELLKLNTLRLYSSGITEEGIEQLFLELMDVLLKIKFNTNIERYNNLEYFIRNEYAFKQAQLFSDQYFINKEKIKSNASLSTIESKLLDDDPICQKEVNIEIRQIITCMAQIARKSKVFSEKLLTQRASTLLEPLGTQTVVEVLNDIINSYIKDPRFMRRNLGFIMALTELLRGLTVHYGVYDDLDKVDDSLETLFGIVLRVATYDIEIMLCLSETFVNIAKYPSRLRLLRKMCIQHSPLNQDYSIIYKLHSVEMRGCKFHIFFILLNHVFRLYESEKMKDNSIIALIKITNNFNFLSYILLVNDVDLKFLRMTQTMCCCYQYFLTSSLILNDIILKNQNSNPDHFKTIIRTAMDGLIILNAILNYTKHNSAFWEIRFPVMNEVYVWMKFNDFLHYNDSRTKIYAKNFTNHSHFHDFFLKKFNVNPIPSTAEIEPVDDNNNGKRAKKPKRVLLEMTRDDIFKEIRDDFQSDEIVIYGYDKQKI